jgi:hypothetical protein
MSTESDTPSTEPATAGLRPWKKGQSGNPHGRRPAGFATVEKLRGVLAKDLPDIIKSVVAKAKEGDLGAAKLVLERVLPPVKAIDMPVLLDPLTGSLTEQGAGILRAMADGALAPGQAAQLLGALGAQAKIMEVDELARRLSELERKMDDRAGTAEPVT